MIDSMMDYRNYRRINYVETYTPRLDERCIGSNRRGGRSINIVEHFRIGCAAGLIRGRKKKPN